MQKDFHVVSEKNYDIVYHTWSSKFAIVPKEVNISKFSDSDMYNSFDNLKKYSSCDNKCEVGNGRIKITYMSSRNCNMGCTYCFANEGDFKKTPKFKNMSYELYSKSFKFMLEKYPEGIEQVNFFGGEPLLNITQIEKFLSGCITTCEKQNKEVPQFSVSSNITLLTPKVAQILKDYNVQVALSLDGPKEINDLARIYKNQKSSVYNSVVKSIKLMNEYEVEYNIQMVINKNHLKNYYSGRAIEWIKDLENLKPKTISIVPVTTDVDYLKIDHDEIEILDKMIRELTQYYIQKLFKKNPYIPCFSLLSPIIDIVNNTVKQECSAGFSVLIDTSGKIYPCQMFCDDDDFCLGDIQNDFLNEEKIVEISQIDRSSGDNCQACEAKGVCRVWCKGIQNLYFGNPQTTCSVRCTMQKAMFQECLKVLARVKNGDERGAIFFDNIQNLFRNKDIL